MLEEYISFDSHRRYTLAEREEKATERCRQARIEHRRGEIRRYLSDARPGTPVAVEATGNWYWIVQEIEEARCVPKLVHPRKAKLMMGMINKTDKLDVHGFNRLQRTGTLPTVWIPPAGLRDLRELTRVRMVLSRQRTVLKNRIGATLAKYALTVEGYSDAFCRSARPTLKGQVALLPEQTAWACTMLLEQLDFVCKQIDQQERRLKDLLPTSPPMRLLRTLPGVGLILSAVIALEVGDVSRFASAQRLASYAGTTPRVHASGGKVRYGTLRPDVNRYLKWAFAEAANSVALHHATHPDRHVSQLYRRIKGRKGHAKAVGAAARHLAEAAFHVLGKGQAYRDPAARRNHREGTSPDNREGTSPDNREAQARNNQDASATLS